MVVSNGYLGRRRGGRGGRSLIWSGGEGDDLAESSELYRGAADEPLSPLAERVVIEKDTDVDGELRWVEDATAMEANAEAVPGTRVRRRGWIEVICGSMFSGKSEELIRRLRRAEIARQPLQVFKPRLDDRYDEEHIVSHNDQRVPSQLVATSAELYRGVRPETRVVGIDEAQFYDEALVEVCQKLAGEGRRVIVAGLDQDYLGRPFEPVPQLLAVAEFITKTRAICVRCGAPANHSQRLIASDERVVVGADDVYEARCRSCFDPHQSG